MQIYFVRMLFTAGKRIQHRWNAVTRDLKIVLVYLFPLGLITFFHSVFGRGGRDRSENVGHRLLKCSCTRSRKIVDRIYSRSEIIETENSD